MNLKFTAKNNLFLSVTLAAYAFAQSSSGQSTAITSCHFHESTLFCKNGNGEEGYVTPAPTATSEAPAQYTACHNHDNEFYCMNGSDEIQFIIANADEAISSSMSTYLTAQSVSSQIAQTTAITSCHFHESTFYCMNGSGEEGYVTPAPTATAEAPAQYTACHNHGEDYYCMNGSNEVQFFIAEEHDDHDEESTVTSQISNSASGQTTAVTACHYHGTAYNCMNGDGQEGYIVPAPTATESTPAEYTGCHTHGSSTFCMNGLEEVQFVIDGEISATSTSTESSTSTDGISCHFHAGVEHCVDADGNTVESTCEKVNTEKNIRLRVGLLFAILASSSFAVFSPIFLRRFANLDLDGPVLTIIRQFGTGVVLSTSLIHLSTHATLMFSSECVGTLSYEGVSTSIMLAGLFIAFLIEYTFNRLLSNRQKKLQRKNSCDGQVLEQKPTTGSDNENMNNEKHQVQVSQVPNGGHNHSDSLIDPHDKLSVMIMEAGIVFHSILIGITLVVAGDSGVITLFIVILFHQMFEGLAVGARISGIRNASMVEMIIMGTVFALITPIGMAIGLGVINKFNGNDRSTLIALGTIDALSAGILLWTGLVEMLAMDWIIGSLKDASVWTSLLAMASLIGGMILMSVLGKWT
ncbi:uncharacterized protein SAPINGB_P001444 [Magnusiomyces paraingens]|uniref:Uncharacterized protein n=1 Tax=Magnusiomyces paraingens TaxID=2606893 RepID=A0A5E8B7W2_9ASCO|nr:uncharacterized protein SAPINGB_P001444 [Saprochaete ingens]VVT46902.1 unnamed protein product [Saprochaete ingens]